MRHRSLGWSCLALATLALGCGSAERAEDTSSAQAPLTEALPDGGALSCATNADCTVTAGTAKVQAGYCDATSHSCRAFCYFADDCGDGQYCNGTTQQCVSDCSPTQPCAAPSTTCDVSGRCVSTTTTSTPVPQLDAQPWALALPLGSPGVPSKITLKLAAPATTTSLTLPVTLNAGPGAEVDCTSGAAATSPSHFASSCQVSSWTFTSGVATAAVWAHLTAAAPPSGASVAIVAPAARSAVRALSLRVAPPVKAPPLVGDYVGQIEIMKSGAAAGTDEVVAVKAIATANGILLIDPSHELSANGTLYYPRAPRVPSPSLCGTDDSQPACNPLQYYLEPWITIPASASLEAVGGFSARFEKNFTTALTNQDGTTTNPDGSVSGDIYAQVATMQTQPPYAWFDDSSSIFVADYRFTLKPSAAGGIAEPACSASSNTCPANTYCDTRVNYCVPGKATAGWYPVGIPGQAPGSWSPSAAGINDGITMPRFNANLVAAEKALEEGMAGGSPWMAKNIGIPEAWSGSNGFEQEVARIYGQGQNSGDTAADARMAGAVECLNPAGTTLTSASLLPRTFGTKLLSFSRDLACADGSLPQSVPLIMLRDKSGANPTTTEANAAQLYAACMRELSADAPFTTGTAKTDLAATMSGGTCINLGHFLATFALSERWSPLFITEMWRQWFAVHGFLAEQGTVQWQAANINGTGGGTADDMNALLERLERGWDFTLANSWQVAAANTRDWRHWVTSANVTALPSDPQVGGGLVAMMETLTSYMKAGDALLSQSAGDVYASCQGAAPSGQYANLIERTATMLRYATAIDQLAQPIRSAYLSPRPGSDWVGNYDTARAEYLTVRQHVAQELAALSTCANPLGIPDQSVPLFFGDPTTETERFLAASKYLSGLANSAITTSQTDYTAAQQEWLTEAQSQVQNETASITLTDKLNAIAAQYGNPVIQACGLSATDPTDVLLNFQSKYLSQCTGGTINEQRIAITAANEDVKIASMQASDAQQSYVTQYNYCVTIAAQYQQQEKVNDDHAQHMNDLLAQKEVADDVAIVADAATACASGGLMSFGASCATAAVAGVAKVVSNGLQVSMEQQQNSFQAEQTDFQYNQSMEACYNEAALRHVGIDTAMEQINRRRIDLAAAVTKLQDLSNQVQQQIAEGQTAYAREQKMGSPSVAHPDWLSKDVQTFTRDFRVAKSLTYLATLAAEYELQQSFASRTDVIKAHQPTELLGAYQEIQNFIGTNGINGNRPAAQEIVLSLRDDILGLKTNRKTGQAYTPSTTNYRLRERLTAPEAAVYDAKGNYVGQGIRFTLTPPAAAQTRCAERLWGISADILGFGLGSTPQGQILVLKRNTGYSQWCEGHSDGTADQFTIVRPRGELYGLTTVSSDDQVETAYSTASLQPFFNESAKVFYQGNPTTLPTGASDELADRALYGDYMIVVPYGGMLSNPSVFDIEKLEDVLIRFDYYSVNNLVVNQ